MILLLATLSLALTWTSSAEAPPVQEAPPSIEWRTLALEQGEPMRYALVLPPDFDPERETPALLVLPPGPQNEAMVLASMDRYWHAEGARRGWIVVSPVAPEGLLFHAGATAAAEALTRQVLAEFPVEGGRLHLAGVSNGGRSAIRLALRAPERWHTLTVVPGMPTSPEDHAGIDRLSLLPTAMFGGGADAAWAEAMRKMHARLEALGGAPVSLHIFDGEGHVPPSLDGGRLLFESLEERRVHVLARRAAEADVRRALDAFHDAASRADGERYFASFAPGAVYMGTDATERWSVAEFRSYAEPYFSQGKGWTYTATERNVTLSPGGKSAWFDERLHNDKYGETRGTGVWVELAGEWKLAHYSLTFPVPNELAGDLVERIRGREE